MEPSPRGAEACRGTGSRPGGRYEMSQIPVIGTKTYA